MAYISLRGIRKRPICIGREVEFVQILEDKVVVYGATYQKRGIG